MVWFEKRSVVCLGWGEGEGKDIHDLVLIRGGKWDVVGVGGRHGLNNTGLGMGGGGGRHHLI